MAISQNFPTTRPSLNLNFARSRKLDSRVTFTRGSTGTYVDDAGLIRTAGINEARFDYDPISGESLGLLVEESRSNLLTYSEQFDNAAWGKSNVTVTANSTVSPDGTTTADTLTRTSGGSIYQDVGGQSGTGTYTYSVFLKAGTETSIILAGWLIGSVSNNFINLTINVNTSTGVMTLGTLGAGTSSSITPYPNGWYRVTATGTGNNASNTTARFEFYFGGNNSFVAWGAQMEAASSFPTSYIPTVASTVTRSADNATITGTNFSDWYNSSEGSVISSFKFYANHPPYYEAVSVAGSGAGFMVIDAAGGLVTDCYGGGTVVTGGDNARTKFITGVRAYKFSTNDSVIGCSGASSITTQTGTITNPNTTALWLGRRGDGGSTYIMNGHIRNVSYYPVRLTNTQLQTLTK